MYRWCSLLLLLGAPAWASAIRVTDAASVTLHYGDELDFRFSTWNFANYTGSAPSSVGFMLSVAPAPGNGVVFDAALLSVDARASLGFSGPLGFTPGYMQATSYKGPVGVLGGTVAVKAEDWARLFGGSSSQVQLALRNTGGDVTLTLPNYTLAQMMAISLGGGNTTMGAMRGDIYLESAPAVSQLVTTLLAVPEPATSALLGGGLVTALALLLRGRRRRG